MPQRNLPDFLERLGQAGELVRIDAEVDPREELAEIAARMIRAGGPALLFGSVRGFDMPVLANLLGTEERICRALDVDRVAQMTQRLSQLVFPAESEGWFDRLKAGPQEAALRKFLPRTVRNGTCQQVVRLGQDIDLGALPLPLAWPGETDRWITAAQFWTVDFDAGRRVIGRYDLAAVDRDRLAVALGDYDEPARLFRQAAGRGRQQQPVAVVLGGDPVGFLAAAAPVACGIDAASLAGLWREKSLELVKCRSVDLEVPAEAEMVLEGYVDTQEPWQALQPACTSTGRYGLPRLAPLVHVTAITQRANPVLPVLIRGRPPHEETIVAGALRKILLPLVQQALPELVDYDLPQWGAVRHWAVLAIRKRYAGQGRKVAQAAWGYDPLMLAKFLVIVDENIDVHDPQAVLSAIAESVRPDRDVMFHAGPADPHDPTTPLDALAQRMALDATTKLPGEHTGPWPQGARRSAEVVEQVTARWAEYGLGPLP